MSVPPLVVFVDSDLKIKMRGKRINCWNERPAVCLNPGTERAVMLIEAGPWRTAGMKSPNQEISNSENQKAMIGSRKISFMTDLRPQLKAF